MQFDAIGTRWSIETLHEIPEFTKESILRRIEVFDATYSRFRDDSLVAALEKSSGTYTFPDDSKKLIAWYRDLYDISGGAVTPLVGSLLSQLGYDKAYSFSPTRIDRVRQWDESMSWNGSTVTTKAPVSLDFGAAGKGYLVDIIGALLEKHGINTYVIDASGDIRHRGGEVQSIGLEHPNDTTRIVGVASLQNSGLCASATNRRRWGDQLHHMVDARTSTPTTEVIATWVVAKNTLIADGLATALFFCDPVKLRQLEEFEYVRYMANGSLEHSKDFVGELFI